MVVPNLEAVGAAFEQGLYVVSLADHDLGSVESPGRPNPGQLGHSRGGTGELRYFVAFAEHVHFGGPLAAHARSTRSAARACALETIEEVTLAGSNDLEGQLVAVAAASQTAMVITCYSPWVSSRLRRSRPPARAGAGAGTIAARTG